MRLLTPTADMGICGRVARYSRLTGEVRQGGPPEYHALPATICRRSPRSHGRYPPQMALRPIGLWGQRLVFTQTHGTSLPIVGTVPTAGLRWTRCHAVVAVSSDASELELPFRNGCSSPCVYMIHGLTSRSLFCFPTRLHPLSLHNSHRQSHQTPQQAR